MRWLRHAGLLAEACGAGLLSGAPAAHLSPSYSVAKGWGASLQQALLRTAPACPQQQEAAGGRGAGSGGSGSTDVDPTKGFVRGGYSVRHFPPERIRNFSIVARECCCRSCLLAHEGCLLLVDWRVLGTLLAGAPVGWSTDPLRRLGGPNTAVTGCGFSAPPAAPAACRRGPRQVHPGGPAAGGHWGHCCGAPAVPGQAAGGEGARDHCQGGCWWWVLLLVCACWVALHVYMCFCVAKEFQDKLQMVKGGGGASLSK